MKKRAIALIESSNSFTSENYKMICTNIEHLCSFNSDKIIMVTSAVSYEGKTTTICNLSVGMASKGKKVLLLECDLRKAKVSEIFDIKLGPGLTDVLAGEVDHFSAIQKLENRDNLHIISAGLLPKEPNKILDSVQFSGYLSKLKDEYDYIFIDTPPVLATSDTLVISKKVDAAILTIAAKESKKKNVMKSYKSLDQLGVKIMGTILTKSSVGNSEFADYYNENRLL